MFRYFLFFTLLFLASCANDPVPIDCNKSDLMVVLTETVMASGCGVPDGKVKIIASGGGGNYQFGIIGSPLQSSGDFNNLTPGIYSFIVRDKNNCEVMLNNITLMAADVSFTANVVENSKCVGGNGSITIMMSGGQPPYQYKMGDGEFDVNNVFTDLDAGNYFITVKDDADCISDLSINVSQGITNTSWVTEILPIMQSSCAVTGCHNGVSRTDLTIYSNAKFYALQIKTYTQNGYMPFEGTITQAEKDRIACWVDEGALEN